MQETNQNQRTEGTDRTRIQRLRDAGGQARRQQKTAANRTAGGAGGKGAGRKYRTELNQNELTNRTNQTKPQAYGEKNGAQSGSKREGRQKASARRAVRACVQQSARWCVAWRGRWRVLRVFVEI